ncbi:MAG: regulatory protein RecX [Pseudomonadota bacterium]
MEEIETHNLNTQNLERKQEDKHQGQKSNRTKKDQKDRKGPKPPKKITEKYLYNSGLAYLQRFPASTSHFRFIMGRKINKSCNHHKDQSREDSYKHLDKVILKFQDLGLLDDQAYLKGMVNSYRGRGLSTRQIQAKLSQKGFGSDEILKTIEQYDYDNNPDQSGEIHAALIFARKKRLGPFDVDNRKDRDKTLGAFARAGYSFDISSKIMELSNEEANESFRLY